MRKLKLVGKFLLLMILHLDLFSKVFLGIILTPSMPFCCTSYYIYIYRSQSSHNLLYIPFSPTTSTGTQYLIPMVEVPQKLMEDSLQYAYCWWWFQKIVVIDWLRMQYPVWWHRPQTLILSPFWNNTPWDLQRRHFLNLRKLRPMRSVGRRYNCGSSFHAAQRVAEYETDSLDPAFPHSIFMPRNFVAISRSLIQIVP